MDVVVVSVGEWDLGCADKRTDSVKISFVKGALFSTGQVFQLNHTRFGFIATADAEEGYVLFVGIVKLLFQLALFGVDFASNASFAQLADNGNQVRNFSHIGKENLGAGTELLGILQRF